MEVQGIPAFAAPRRGDQVAAGLVFRVGRVDESLATAGITHLVEHLALHGRRHGHLHYNGQTADVFTHFLVEGNLEEVVEHLNGVCASLRALPLERLDTERQILQTEAAGRTLGPAHAMPLFRYGAQGFGLASYPEMGVASVDRDVVQRWAAQRFTAATRPCGSPVTRSREGSTSPCPRDGVAPFRRPRLPSPGCRRGTERAET